MAVIAVVVANKDILLRRHLGLRQLDRWGKFDQESRSFQDRMFCICFLSCDVGSRPPHDVVAHIDEEDSLRESSALDDRPQRCAVADSVYAVPSETAGGPC